MADQVVDTALPVVQSVGIIGSLLVAAFALRMTSRSTRAQCLLSITSSHREIWRSVAARPNLSEALSPTADPASITSEERYFLRELILHLAACLEAERLGTLPVMEHLDVDVCQLLSRPKPMEVWKELRGYQNRRFVAFVDATLANRASDDLLPH